MTAHTFFFSESSLRYLKRSARRGVSGVPSSHLSEAIAAALGFRTHAALRAALAGKATAEAQKPSNARLIQRLQQLGHNVPDDLQLLPEFEHSYFPFSDVPLRTKRGIRWQVWRNLMVAAINAGLEQRLFGLAEGENWWPGATQDGERSDRGIYRFLFADDLPVLVGVDAVRGGELSVKVILRPKKPDIRPEWYCDLNSGEATAHGWLERRLGSWIQDGGEKVHCKRALQDRIAGAVIPTAGYSEQGSFIM